MRITPPGSTIGILGGGQLGRMTALAAASLGYKTHIYASHADEPACQVTPHVTLGNFEDKAQLKVFADAVDVITLEWENVPVDALRYLSALKPVHPGAEVLAITQDRVKEKSFSQNYGLSTPEFRAVNSAASLLEAVKALGLPVVLKTARLGYDGKGQVVIRAEADVQDAWQRLNTDHAIAEAFVPYEKEISVIVARREDGVLASYPVAENRHKQGILDETHVPAMIRSSVEQTAKQIAERLADKLDVIGLLAVEMFVVGNKVLINEMAPRPHNSGHWTMDAAATSQFEQLVRAICGLPLGDPALTAPAVMKNLIGDDVLQWQALLKEPGAHVHLYGKTEARQGRKMGHVTRVT